MLDPITRNAIVFNGENYNFQELRQKLVSAGDLFNSYSDTEVILALYRKYGIDCLKFLCGMFAPAIWDRKRQRLFWRATGWARSRAQLRSDENKAKLGHFILDGITGVPFIAARELAERLAHVGTAPRS